MEVEVDHNLMTCRRDGLYVIGDGSGHPIPFSSHLPVLYGTAKSRRRFNNKRLANVRNKMIGRMRWPLSCHRPVIPPSYFTFYQRSFNTIQMHFP